MRTAYLTEIPTVLSLWRRILLFSCCLTLTQLVQAAPETAKGPQRTIQVSLFGQPCLLQGPADEALLRATHSLSPEEIYPKPQAALDPNATRRALEKLKAVAGAPAGLDRYRERLSKRLSAQLALLNAIEAAREEASGTKPGPLLSVAKTHLRGKTQKDFETAVKKAEATKTLLKSETIESLFETFGSGIEPDPEEEFHRSIQRMGVQYACSFESAADAVGEAAQAPTEEERSGATQTGKKPAATNPKR